MESIDDVVEHFGIKGMRWGVRRREGSDGTVGSRFRSTSRPDPSHDAERAGELRIKAKRGGLQSLSNAELKALNERLNLEQNYSNLTGKNSYGKKAATEGENFAKNVLLGTGQELAKKVLVQKGAALLVKKGLLAAKGG